MHTDARRTRYVELDALRAASVAAVFLLHFANLYAEPSAGYVRHLPVAVTLLAMMPPWRMPMLFFVAGLSMLPALGTRSAAAYAMQRARRLLVPFVFGWLALTPLQGVLWASAHREHYHERLSDPGFYWFLAVLALVTLALYPVAAWARSHTARLERLPARYAVVVLVALSVGFCVPARVSLALPTLYGRTAGTIGSYLACSAAGLALGAAPAMRGALRRWTDALLIASVAAFIGMRASGPAAGASRLGVALAGISLACLVCGLYGLAVALCGHLDGPRRATVTRWTRLAFPCYLTHGPALAAVAALVLPWRLPIAVEVAAVVIGAVCLTIATAAGLAATTTGRALLGMPPTAADAAPVSTFSLFRFHP